MDDIYAHTRSVCRERNNVCTAALLDAVLRKDKLIDAIHVSHVYEGMRLLYPLHCRYPIMFELGNVFCPANVELDTEWYVAFGGVKF